MKFVWACFIYAMAQVIWNMTVHPPIVDWSRLPGISKIIALFQFFGIFASPIILLVRFGEWRERVRRNN